MTPAGHRPDAGLTHDVTTALARWAADLICSDLVREFTWRVSLANWTVSYEWVVLLIVSTCLECNGSNINWGFVQKLEKINTYKRPLRLAKIYLTFDYFSVDKMQENVICVSSNSPRKRVEFTQLCQSVIFQSPNRPSLFPTFETLSTSVHTWWWTWRLDSEHIGYFVNNTAASVHEEEQANQRREKSNFHSTASCEKQRRHYILQRVRSTPWQKLYWCLCVRSSSFIQPCTTKINIW